MRSSGSRMNPARVANDEAETGTLKAPCTWPAACVTAGLTSRTVASPGRSRCSIGAGAPTNGPLFNATTLAVVGGRGVDTDAELVTNACLSSKPSAAFEFISAPMVDECAGLIAAPHNEPATWPGYTSVES